MYVKTAALQGLPNSLYSSLNFGFVCTEILDLSGELSRELIILGSEWSAGRNQSCFLLEMLNKEATQLGRF